MHSDRYSAQLQQVLDAVSFLDTGVRWFGEDVLGTPLPDVRASDGPDPPEVEDLASILYSYCYTVGLPVLRGEYEAIVKATTHEDITSDLLRSNGGKGRVEPDWRFVRIDPRTDRIIVHKDGLTLSVGHHQIVRDSAQELSMGDVVAVLTPTSALMKSPGFYVAHSDVAFPVGAAVSRIYLNAACSDAARLMNGVTQLLNRRGLAFDFKVANDALYFYRCDVAVLYIERDRFREAMMELAPLLEALRPSFGAQVPGLTYEIGRGVGVADSPPNGDSFGLNRCKLLAKAIRSALPVSARLDHIEAAFAASGLDMAAPYLNAGADDIYAAAT